MEWIEKKRKKRIHKININKKKTNKTQSEREKTSARKETSHIVPICECNFRIHDVHIILLRQMASLFKARFLKGTHYTLTHARNFDYNARSFFYQQFARRCVCLCARETESE